MAASDYTPATFNYRLHLPGCPQMESGRAAFNELNGYSYRSQRVANSIDNRHDAT
jgi:hypothetical protein